MARAIDAYTLNNDLVSWYNDTEDEKEKSILRRVMQRVVQAPTLTPPNEPLTLEELREMDGEPVWLEYSNGAHQWHIVKDIVGYANINVIRWRDGGLESIQDYGKTWLAYRCPPEREV